MLQQECDSTLSRRGRTALSFREVANDAKLVVTPVTPAAPSGAAIERALTA
jgi:hypothetical protein